MTTELNDKEVEVKKLRTELEEERDKGAIEGEGQVIEGPEGLKLTRLEVARVLRERNEYKEKYLSLLEQIRYDTNDTRNKENRGTDDREARLGGSTNDSMEKLCAHNT